jgi:hypothetical protein
VNGETWAETTVSSDLHRGHDSQSCVGPEGSGTGSRVAGAPPLRPQVVRTQKDAAARNVRARIRHRAEGRLIAFGDY